MSDSTPAAVLGELANSGIESMRRRPAGGPGYADLKARTDALIAAGAALNGHVVEDPNARHAEALTAMAQQLDRSSWSFPPGSDQYRRVTQRAAACRTGIKALTDESPTPCPNAPATPAPTTTTHTTSKSTSTAAASAGTPTSGTSE